LNNCRGLCKVGVRYCRRRTSLWFGGRSDKQLVARMAPYIVYVKLEPNGQRITTDLVAPVVLQLTKIENCKILKDI